MWVNILQMTAMVRVLSLEWFQALPCKLVDMGLLCSFSMTALFCCWDDSMRCKVLNVGTLCSLAMTCGSVEEAGKNCSPER